MLVGKLNEDLTANNFEKTLSSLTLTDYMVPGDVSYGTLDISTLDDEGIIQIGNERFKYEYKSGLVCYNVERGWLNTPIEEHSIGDFVFQVPEIIVKNYDSRNIYDLKVEDDQLVLSSGVFTVIRGMDAISQEIKMTMQDIGNLVLSKYQTTDIDLNELSVYYLNELVQIGSFITDVEINSIGVATDNPNKLAISVNVEVGGKIYNNLEFLLPVKETI